ncbi:MAG: aminoglycoside phosphotransferase family protein [Kiritimatiellae bacterium]|nr:aminoglycoside phosphotransferase family protein [Kiritimatiellia bacterium]
MQTAEFDIKKVSRNFQMPGRLVKARRLGYGHINDTFLLIFERNKSLLRLVLQRINHHVFKNPVALMANFERILTHLHAIWSKPGSFLKPLELIPARNGKPLHHDDDGNYWRSYLYVDGTSYGLPDKGSIAKSAANIFGRFQCDLSDFPSPRLNETIPDFHNTVKRFKYFEKVCEKDPANRASSAKREIAFALQRKTSASVLIDLQKKGELPERIVHNDAKLNNVIFDRKINHAVSIVDLDTVMPGLVLYDVGDLIRTMTCTADEDERNLSKVSMCMSLFKSIAMGYLSSASGFLTKCEREHLVFSGKLITFEIGLRFLTDYINGDTYFRIHRPDQNLDRCRCQFKLVESIETQEKNMRKFVDSLA